MLKFLNLQSEIFGIDISDSSLKIVKLKKKNKGFEFISLNETEIGPGIIKEGIIQDKDALIKVISLACRSVKGEKLDTKYVSISLPDDKSFVQLIQSPKIKREELKTAIHFEISNYIPLPIDKVYFDFQIINTHHNQDSLHLDILINVMPKSVIDSYMYCFKKSGLIPCILEIKSNAIVRALLKTGEEPLSTIFIDFGDSKINFIVFSGHFIRFTFSASISFQQLTNAIMNSEIINFKETAKDKKNSNSTEDNNQDILKIKNISPVLTEFIEQIKKYINFYNNHVSYEHFTTGDKIQKITLCGDQKTLKWLPNFIFNQLKIPADFGDPLVNISSINKISDYLISSKKLSSFTAVIGLALRGATDQILDGDNGDN